MSVSAVIRNVRLRSLSGRTRPLLEPVSSFSSTGSAIQRGNFPGSAFLLGQTGWKTEGRRILIKSMPLMDLGTAGEKRLDVDLFHTSKEESASLNVNDMKPNDSLSWNYFSQSEQMKDDKSSGNSDKPSRDVLQNVYNTLQKNLERTFTHPMDYSIYHPEILFIDRIRNLRTQGLPRYIQQVSLLKIVGHVKFAYVRFEIINMSIDNEEGRITVRWRIKGLSGLRVMLKFWKYKLWKWQEIKDNQEVWYDGISYYDVGGDGKIFQHIADKVMEDKQRELDEKPASGRSSIPLAAKLGGLATIFPTPSLSYGNASHSSTVAGLKRRNNYQSAFK